MIKGALLRLFTRVERVFEYAFGQRHNPFTWLGAFGWYFYWITAATGIYLYIFFDTGVVDAYASVEYMTNEQWYAAGVMRSLHRYASDALVVVMIGSVTLAATACGSDAASEGPEAATETARRR